MASEQEPTNSAHVQLFITHYDQLLRWARYLCQGDIAAAEDLVQTAYIQFVTAHPSLDTIDNPLGYLHRLVSNLHKNQLVRTMAKKHGGSNQFIALSLIEEMVASGVTDNQQARDLLIDIAYFASERRQYSKTGAVLILRFLLGYFPKEISQLLTVSIFAINNLIMRGRQELRDFLKDPPKYSKLHHR
ncbi:MAG: RNA polymerase sigma factor [Acidobacteriota bacterium]